MELEVAQYLASKKHKPHEWAINDCNTFIVEWIDKQYGTDFEGLLQFDYTSALGAARYHKQLPFNAEEFMYIAGYDAVEEGYDTQGFDTPNIKTGDVVLQNTGPWFCAWLVLQDLAYSIHHKMGFVGVPLNTLDRYTLWRRP